ncbi:hypothetical protein F441_19199, partial [Phytophthora nicotianae CJ01A1]
MKVAQALAFASTASAVAHAYTFSENQAPAPAPNSVQSTGLTVNQESRIYGGSEANIDDYPFIASLRFELQDETFCGGTLIAPQYILTAGHCIKTEEDTIIAHLGTEFGTGSKTGEAIKVVEGYRHPMYNQKKHLYDVGLLKLEEASTQKTAKVCAADGSDNSVGTEATVLGWGMTEDGTKSNTLQEVNVAVISNAECNKQYNNRITEGMMCAGNGGGKDSCNGDSGGPLVTSDDTLIGFVSWGGKCGVHAGVYTRLTFVMDYINDVLNGGTGSNFTDSTTSSGSPTQDTSLASSTAGSSATQSSGAGSPETSGASSSLASSSSTTPAAPSSGSPTTESSSSGTPTTEGSSDLSETTDAPAVTPAATSGSDGGASSPGDTLISGSTTTESSSDSSVTQSKTTDAPAVTPAATSGSDGGASTGSSLTDDTLLSSSSSSGSPTTASSSDTSVDTPAVTPAATDVDTSASTAGSTSQLTPSTSGCKVRTRRRLSLKEEEEIEEDLKKVRKREK